MLLQIRTTKSVGNYRDNWLRTEWIVSNVVALTFSRRYKRSDWRFCACTINVKSTMCSETTKHLWYTYHGLFVRCIKPLSKVICRKLTRGKQVLRHISIASVNHVTLVRQNPWQLFFFLNVLFYCIDRHFKKLLTVTITGKLTNSSWYLYRKCFVVLLDMDDFIFIAHAQERQSERV